MSAIGLRLKQDWKSFQSHRLQNPNKNAWFSHICTPNSPLKKVGRMSNLHTELCKKLQSISNLVLSLCQPASEAFAFSVQNKLPEVKCAANAIYFSRKKYCAEGKRVGFNTEVCSLPKIAVQFTLSTLNCLAGPKYFRHLIQQNKFIACTSDKANYG